MLAFIQLLAVLLARGTSGTKQYPWPGQLLSAHPYQFLGQQAAPMDYSAQLPLRFLQQSPPSALQQQQFLQPSAQQVQQSVFPSVMDDPNLVLGEQPQSSAASALAQMQNAVASVPVKEVMQLMQSVETLQKKADGFQKQLLEGHSREKELNDAAYAATYRSNVIDQNARKLASLAQTSVSQAQKSMDEEKVMVQAMKTRITSMEKEEQGLRAELSETRMSLKRSQDKEVVGTARSQMAVKDWQQRWAEDEQEKQELLATLRGVRQDEAAAVLPREGSVPHDLEKLEAKLEADAGSRPLPLGSVSADAVEPPLPDSSQLLGRGLQESPAESLAQTSYATERDAWPPVAASPRNFLYGRRLQ